MNRLAHFFTQTLADHNPLPIASQLRPLVARFAKRRKFVSILEVDALRQESAMRLTLNGGKGRSALMMRACAENERVSAGWIAHQSLVRYPKCPATSAGLTSAFEKAACGEDDRQIQRTSRLRLEAEARFFSCAVRRHCAMVLAVATAAGCKIGLRGRTESGTQQRGTEECQQQDGGEAPQAIILAHTGANEKAASKRPGQTLASARAGPVRLPALLALPELVSPPFLLHTSINR